MASTQLRWSAEVPLQVRVRATVQLADFLQVTSARLEDGLLHIDRVREIPETKKTPYPDQCSPGDRGQEGRVTNLVTSQFQNGGCCYFAKLSLSGSDSHR
jgi:hypothetical protein